MRFQLAALAAGFLATTSAFLLPPNLEDIKEEIKDARFRGAPKHFKDLIHSLLEQKTTTIDLECPGCPYVVESSEVKDTEVTIPGQENDNSIHLDFDTHDNSFNVNGWTLLPVEQVHHDSPLMVKGHKVTQDSVVAEESVDIALSFSVEVFASFPSTHREDVFLVPVEFTILAMNGIPVKVNTVVFKLIQTPDKGYVIVHTEQIPWTETPGAETCEGARSWTVCRIKAIIASHLKAIMEKTKEKTDKVHGWFSEKTSGCGKGRGFFRHTRPHGEHPHRPHWKDQYGRPHHGHHHHHRLGHMLHQTVRFFVIPALLGIIGGLAASAIGMLVGRAIIYLWFRTYRNGQRGPLRIYEREIVICEEQDGLLAENDETPPMYEDAPKYEEAVAQHIEVDVDDEKQ